MRDAHNAVLSGRPVTINTRPAVGRSNPVEGRNILEAAEEPNSSNDVDDRCRP